MRQAGRQAGVRERWAWQGSARFTLRDERGLVVARREVRNTITDVGRSLLRDALGGFATDISIKRVALGAGLGALTSALNSGTAYTSLATSALARAVNAGDSLTLESTTNTQVVTVAAPGAALGATSVPVNSFTASANFPTASYPSATGTLLARTPAASQTALDSEQYRRAPTAFSQTTTTSLLTTVYVDPPSANGFLIGEVGWFAGPSASDVSGSGSLVARLLYCVPNKTNLLSIEIDRTDQW